MRLTEHAKALLVAVICLLISTIALISFVAVTLTSEEPPWTPLGPFPEQRVVAIVDGFIETEGTKCYREPVFVFGEVRWQSVTPRGAVVPTFSGTSNSTRNGCLDFEFRNEIPDKVAELVADGFTEWRIAGFEIPFDEIQDREGARLDWTTEPFTLTLEDIQ